MLFGHFLGGQTEKYTTLHLIKRNFKRERLKRMELNSTPERPYALIYGNTISVE